MNKYLKNGNSMKVKNIKFFLQRGIIFGFNAMDIFDAVQQKYSILTKVFVNTVDNFQKQFYYFTQQLS